MPEHEPRFNAQPSLSNEQSDDAENLKCSIAPVPYERSPQWLGFFARVASEVVRSLRPRRVFDAGCAWGLLVEALRDWGVDARGVDSSSYAISKVRSDMQSYCRAGRLTDPISGTYDLITCIAALEYMPEDRGREAVRQMCRATDTILFYSAPKELDESGFSSLQPGIHWLRVFAEFGFEPDLLYDASYVTNSAFLLRRRVGLIRDDVLLLFAEMLGSRIDKAAPEARQQEREALDCQTNSDLRREIVDAYQRNAELEVLIEAVRKTLEAEVSSVNEKRRSLEAKLAVLQTELDTERHSPAAKLVGRYRTWMDPHRRRQSLVARLIETPILWGLKICRVAPLSRPSATAPEVHAAEVPTVEMPTAQFHAQDLPTAQVAGVPTAEVPTPDVPLADDVSQEVPGTEACSAEGMSLTIDDPGLDTAIFRDAILRINGWAVAESGIDRVLIWLEDDGPYEASYGFPRPDVQSYFPGFSNSGHSGFIWCSPTTQLGSGFHAVRVQGVSKEGHTVETTRTFSIDVQSEYEVWADLHAPTERELARMRIESGGWHHQPKISIVTPVYRTSETHLQKCIDSVQHQSYVNWELILVDDASGEPGLTAMLSRYAAGDPRINFRALATNAGIAGATNAAIEMSSGEYVAFLDHDDEISPDALHHIVLTLNEDPSLDMLYSDEDKLDSNGKRTASLFKPDWSPDLLGSMNFVSHFLVCRRELLNKLSGLRLGFDGSQDFDLVLRISEHTGKIRRVPKVLYHWRMHPKSSALHAEAKPASSESGKRALNDHLVRTGVNAEAEEISLNRYRIRYKILGQPEIAIVIPAGGSEKLRTALETVLRDSTYPNYRVVVVDNSPGEDVREWVREFQGGRHRVDWLDCRNLPFNFSLLCNRGAAETDSPYLLLLNDDTSIITPDWMEAMIEHGQRPEVGAVGCMLLFPNGAIQHAGVVMGLFGVGGHPFRGLDEKKGPYYFSLSHVTRNCAAVTGACLLIRREVFEEVGGFDETNLPTCFQDVDVCLKIWEEGYRIVYTPHARLYHHESATKTAIADLPEIEYMQSRWKTFIDNDPFYNPNLTRNSDSYELDVPRRHMSKLPVEPLTRDGVGAEPTVPPIQNPFVSSVCRKRQSLSSTPGTVDYAALYQRHTEALLGQYPLDKAMSLAVGGQFEAFGVLLRQVLLDAGLLSEHYLIDIGCGSGRLAHKVDVAHYLGADVVPALVEYARSICGRPEWRFEVIHGISIPERDEQADMVCFFSVFTHLLHEDTYRYLKEAVRVLKPGGKIVFSFHEWRVASNWLIFEGMIRAREQGESKHHDQYIEREAIEAWSRHLGLEIESICQGDIPHIRVPYPITLDDGTRIEGITSLGQSVCVLRK